jgi:hypothetical protein
MKDAITTAKLNFLYLDQALIDGFGKFPSENKAAEIMETFVGIAFGLVSFVSLI